MKHNVREDRLDETIRESEPEFPIGWPVSRPEVHLVGPLLGDQQPREINKAVNTNCRGDGHKGELIFHSTREVCPIKTCPSPYKITSASLLESLKGCVTDSYGWLELYKCHQHSMIIRSVYMEKYGISLSKSTN